MRSRAPSTPRIALALIGLWLGGWRQVPGYTVVVQEGYGDIYVALQLRKRGP